jgi:hypothetical protein
MMTEGPIARARLGSTVWIFVRVSFAASLLITLAVFYGEALVSQWLSAYRVIFSWVADDFRLLDLVINHEGADRVVRAQVTWRRLVMVGGKAIFPDPLAKANASTLMAHALQGPVVAALATIAWPITSQVGSRRWLRNGIEYLLRGIVLFPLLVVLVLVDIPVVLAGELWSMVLEALDPNAFSLTVLLKTFIQGGGRYALALVASLLSVLLARRLIQFCLPSRLSKLA